jgi:DNA topoisomerase-3
MRLVVTEKPSVAMAISKVLGADTRRDGYYEGNGWLVSWCIGHLIELADPDAYGDTYSIWKYEDLPILPKEWKYCISESTKKQFSVLKELMNRPVEEPKISLRYR